MKNELNADLTSQFVGLNPTKLRDVARSKVQANSDESIIIGVAFYL